MSCSASLLVDFGLLQCMLKIVKCYQQIMQTHDVLIGSFNSRHSLLRLENAGCLAIYL